MVGGVCACGMRAGWGGASDPCTRTRRPYQAATSGDGVIVATHLAPEDAARLVALAAHRGLSRSALMREAVLSLIGAECTEAA